MVAALIELPINRAKRGRELLRISAGKRRDIISDITLVVLGIRFDFVKALLETLGKRCELRDNQVSL